MELEFIIYDYWYSIPEPTLHPQALGLRILPIAPNWAMCLLSTAHVQTTKHCRFYRGQQLGPVPHNTGHAAISTFIAYIKVYVETFSLHTSTSVSSLIISSSYVEARVSSCV